MEAEDCRKVLEAYGIPYAPYLNASDVEAARKAAGEMGYPVVMKIVSPQILHKTYVVGVALGIKNARQLADAYDEMMANVRRRMPGA